MSDSKEGGFSRRRFIELGVKAGTLAIIAPALLPLKAEAQTNFGHTADNILSKAPVSVDANQKYFPDWFNATLGQPIPEDYAQRGNPQTLQGESEGFTTYTLPTDDKFFPTRIITNPEGKVVYKLMYISPMTTTMFKFSVIAPILGLAPGQNPNPDFMATPPTDLLGDKEKNLVFTSKGTGIIAHDVTGGDMEIDAIEAFDPTDINGYKGSPRNAFRPTATEEIV